MIMKRNFKWGRHLRIFQWRESSVHMHEVSAHMHEPSVHMHEVSAHMHEPPVHMHEVSVPLVSDLALSLKYSSHGFIQDKRLTVGWFCDKVGH